MKKTLKISILLTSLIILGGGILNKENSSQNDTETLAIYVGESKTDAIPSKENYVFENAVCTVNGKTDETVKVLWDEEAWAPILYNLKDHSTKCTLYFKEKYQEEILNGAGPVLQNDLLPVTIDNDGTVKKANLGKEWYSYEKKNWANAVILEDPYDSLNTQGKVHGATKEEGYVSFDGIDDYIDLGLANYNFTNGLTIGFTFSINEFNDTANEVLLGNLEGAGTAIYVRPDGELRMALYTNYTENLVRIETNKILELNQKYSIVVIGSAEYIWIYLDGKLLSEAAIDYKTISSNMPFFIGANPQANGEHTEISNMSVYQAQVYDRAVTDEESKAISEGKVLNTEGLLKYVDFTNKTYQSEEIIPEEAIESYFVWIPKYRYQLWDLGEYDGLTTINTTKVHEIPIIFGDYNTSDSVEGECTTPMESGATGNCEVGDYMTHPAFLSIPSTGFWVGKFETGYNGATSSSEASKNENDASKVIIKPNTYSWRGIQLANAFYTSYNYKRELDSHMMKNTEWGAVAYLQHSKYGSTSVVRLNNHSDYITGYQANAEPTCGYTGESEECNKYCSDGSCNSAYPNSNLASTTGNITGIFDMSGGAQELTMSTMLDQNGNIMSGRNNLYNSGFNGSLGCPNCDAGTDDSTQLVDGYEWPDRKYYDVYNYSSVYNAYSKRILGDATAELGPFAIDGSFPSGQEKQRGSWYNNLGYTNYYADPWFLRGFLYNYGNDVSIFSYGGGRGEAVSTNSYRIVLTPV